MTSWSKYVSTTKMAFCPYFNESMWKRFIFDPSHVFTYNIGQLKSSDQFSVTVSCSQHGASLSCIPKQTIDIIHLDTTFATYHLRSIGCRRQEVKLTRNGRCHRCSDSVELISDAIKATAENSNQEIGWIVKINKLANRLLSTNSWCTRQ